jgi:hypothetical protein
MIMGWGHRQTKALRNKHWRLSNRGCNHGRQFGLGAMFVTHLMYELLIRRL